MSTSLLRNLFMSFVLVGALVSPALAADPEISTDAGLVFSALLGISAGVQDAWSDKGFPSADVNEGVELTLAGHGHVNIPLSDSFSTQLDAQSEFYDRHGNSENDDDATGAYMLGGHLSWRDSETGLLGIFGATGLGTNKEGSDSEEGSGDGLGVLAGVEGQLYLDRLTFYVQGGWGDFVEDHDDVGDEGFTDGWFVRGVARCFLGEDTLLQIEASYGETPAYESDSAGEIWNWGALGKTRLTDSMPIYGTLEYRGGYYEEAELTPEAVEEHAVLIGVDFAFGAASLFENDRRGATLDTPMLPARTAAWTESVD